MSNSLTWKWKNTKQLADYFTDRANCARKEQETYLKKGKTNLAKLPAREAFAYEQAAMILINSKFETLE